MDGMATAQARYDAAEPPEEKECTFCDGQGVVAVTEVRAATGDRYSFHSAAYSGAAPCPICELGLTLNGERLE